MPGRYSYEGGEIRFIPAMDFTAGHDDEEAVLDRYRDLVYEIMRQTGCTREEASGFVLRQYLTGKAAPIHTVEEFAPSDGELPLPNTEEIKSNLEELFT